jgi:hypothetical protein
LHDATFAIAAVRLVDSADELNHKSHQKHAPLLRSDKSIPNSTNPVAERKWQVGLFTSLKHKRSTRRLLGQSANSRAIQPNLFETLKSTKRLQHWFSVFCKFSLGGMNFNFNSHILRMSNLIFYL